MGALLLLAAWLSGAAALVAETVWFRGLGRAVGTSAEALAVVSAAFLGGLGLGAAVAGRLAPRARRPLAAAALCEALAALAVLLSPLAVARVPDAHRALLGAFGLAPGPSAWPAAAAAIPVLLVPAAFLGATLPFLVRGVVGGLARAGRWTGGLYGVNTLGAASGVALAAFLLLPGVGETASLRWAAAGNAAAGALLYVAHRRARSAPDLATEGPPTAHVGGGPTLRPWAPALALFGSGLFALGAEVAWFRLLEPLTGVHVFGFALLLVAVLLGTAAGGAIGGKLADAVRRPDLGLAATLGVGGALTVLSIRLAGDLPWRAAAAGTDAVAAARAAGAVGAEVTAAGRHAVLLARLAWAVLTVAPPLLAFAAAYPLAVRARARSVAQAAGAAGAVYAWNTLGNVVGSLLAGFLLLPLLGGPLTLALLGGFSLLLGATLWLAAPAPRSPLGAALFLLPVAFLATPGAASRLEESGPRLPEVVALGKWYEALAIESAEDFRFVAEVIGGTYPTRPGEPDGPPIRPREGTTSTVGLLDERGTIRLRQGGLAESKFRAEAPDAGSETEVALGILPYLAHPDPKTALVIGHGAGWTVEALLAGALERVDVAELEPAVLATVTDYRGPLEVFRSPIARLHVADGRLLLREAAASGKGYDLVVSQPSHPWVPGAGHLFTRDAYRLARAALAPRGVFAQWLNLFQMDADLLRTALASFVEVFPDAWVFLYTDELVLVGFLAPPTLDPARWDGVFAREALGARARDAGISLPEDLWRRFVADGAGLRRIVGPSARPSTDDEPRLETGLAWAVFSGETRTKSERAALTATIRGGFPPDLTALLPDPTTRDAFLARTAARAAEAGGEEASRWIEEVPFDGGALGRRARGRQRLREARARGLSDAERERLRSQAVTLLREAAAAAPRDPEAAQDLLDALRVAGSSEEAARVGAGFAADFPEDGPLLAAWAQALLDAGEAERALEALARAQAATGRAPPAGLGLRRARLLLEEDPERRAEARDALRADRGVAREAEALALLLRLEEETSPDPARPTAEAERAREDLARARRAEAAAALGRARRLLYDDDVAGGLAAAREATQGRPDAALAWRYRGWFELRDKAFPAAASSLATAVARSQDPATERRRARAWLRVFRRDPDELDRATPAPRTETPE